MVLPCGLPDVISLHQISSLLFVFRLQVSRRNIVKMRYAVDGETCSFMAIASNFHPRAPYHKTLAAIHIRRLLTRLSPISPHQNTSSQDPVGITSLPFTGIPGSSHTSRLGLFLKPSFPPFCLQESGHPFIELPATHFLQEMSLCNGLIRAKPWSRLDPDIFCWSKHFPLHLLTPWGIST